MADTVLWWVFQSDLAKALVLFACITQFFVLQRHSRNTLKLLGPGREMNMVLGGFLLYAFVSVAFFYTEAGLLWGWFAQLAEFDVVVLAVIYFIAGLGYHLFDQKMCG